MNHIKLTFFLLLISCSPEKRDVITEQHSDGTPKLIIRYENGIKTKEFEFYFNGKKKKMTSYKDTIKDGEVKGWHEYGGNLHYYGHYKMGKQDGLSTEYDTGGIRTREILYKNGEQMIHTKFHWNDVNSFQINSIEDKVYSWYENEVLQAEIPNRKGINREYYEDGSKKVEGSIAEGKQNGVWEYWDSSGKLIKEITFKNSVAVDSLVHIEELAHTVKSIWN